MRSIVKSLSWRALMVVALLLTSSELLGYDEGNEGESDPRSLGELSSQLGEWASLSSHHSLDMLGISEMECNCTFTSGEDERLWLFQTEPEIRHVQRNGPSDGKLKSGDVIVAIDGMLITTRKAGVRFANLVAGEPVELEVRRWWKTRTVTVVPRTVSEPDIPIELTVRRSDRLNTVTIEPRATALPGLARSIERLSRRAVQVGNVIGSIGLPAPPEISRFPELNVDFSPMTPLGWIGFGLSFEGSIQRRDDGEPAEWRFNQPPSIKSIQPGSPAQEAGLMVDDVLLQIDGVKLDSKKGSDRFSRMEPGQIVEWKVRRGGQTLTVETEAAHRPHSRSGDTESESSGMDTFEPVRYTGTLGNTDIEVRSGRNVQVEVDEEINEIIIRTGDSVVRLKTKDGR